MIFSYLEIDDLVRCQRLCRAWYQLLTTDASIVPTLVEVSRSEYHDCYYVNGFACNNLDEVGFVCNSMSKLGNITSLAVTIDPRELIFTASIFRCFLPLECITIDIHEISCHDVACMLDSESLKSLKSLKLLAHHLVGDDMSFFEELGCFKAPKLEELTIMMSSSEDLVQSLMSGAPNLTRLSLGANDYEGITLHSNRVSHLKLYLVAYTPQLKFPKLTTLKLDVHHPVTVIGGKNGTRLKVKLLVLRYTGRFLTNVLNLVSFYNLGGNLKCLFINPENVSSKLPWSLLALLPNLQGLDISNNKLAKGSVSRMLRVCPSLKVLYCNPAAMSKGAKDLLQKHNVIVTEWDRTNVCKFCRDVHSFD
jgi:hypothetical protein